MVFEVRIVVFLGGREGLVIGKDHKTSKMVECSSFTYSVNFVHFSVCMLFQ